MRAKSHPTLCNPMDCKTARLLCPWDSPGKNTWVSCHALFQGIFPTQGSNLHLLRLPHFRQILYCWGGYNVKVFGVYNRAKVSLVLNKLLPLGISKALEMRMGSFFKAFHLPFTFGRLERSHHFRRVSKYCAVQLVTFMSKWLARCYYNNVLNFPI